MMKLQYQQVGCCYYIYFLSYFYCCFYYYNCCCCCCCCKDIEIERISNSYSKKSNVAYTNSVLRLNINNNYNNINNNNNNNNSPNSNFKKNKPQQEDYNEKDFLHL